MRRFLQCRELHGVRDSVLLGRYYIFLLKIKVCLLSPHSKLNAILNTYHTFASCSLWLICLSTSCFCNSAAVAAAFLWMAAAAAASLAAATRWAAATASFNDANLCCRATNCFALALASASAADEISCDLYIETTKDFQFVDISFREVSSSILVRSSSREMALRYCYSGYIAYICIYTLLSVSMFFFFFI